jgi:hypothetical protein
MIKGYSQSPISLGIILLITPVLLALSSCTKNVEITQEFTHRMAASDEERTRVQARANTLKQDCEQGLAQEPYCYNGETWYTDQVMAKFNGWITALQNDLVETNSLSNVPSYDPDYRAAYQNAESFTKWVDQVHRSFIGQTSQGANAAPTLVEAIPPIVEAATAVWKEYREGQQAQVDRVKASMEEQKFPAYGAIP